MLTFSRFSVQYLSSVANIFACKTLWLQTNLWKHEKMAGMWILFLSRRIVFVARSLSGPWTRWIGPAPIQMRGCCRQCVVVTVWWAAVQFCHSALILRLSQTPTSCVFGIGLLRARLLGLCCTADFPPIFLQLRKRPLWSCMELLQSFALWTDISIGTVKPRLPAVRELFLGLLGRGEGVWLSEGYWGLRKRVQWSPGVGGAKCIWSCWTEETCGVSGDCISFSRSRCRAVVPGVLTCVHVYMSWGGWKIAPDMCVICRNRQVYTQGPVLLTL